MRLTVKTGGSFLLLLGLALLAGCASMFMKGGTLVDDGYKPAEYLVDYEGDANMPANTSYHLVKKADGTMAIFERSEIDGGGTLMENHWSDDAGDHYAGWVSSSHGYEFVVPKDLTQPAKRYVYPKGYYDVKTIDGVARPVPTTPMDPVTTLTPKAK